MIFEFCRETTKKCLCPKLRYLSVSIFFLERALRYLEGCRTIIGHFGTRRIFYGHQNDENPQMKISKNTIFLGPPMFLTHFDEPSQFHKIITRGRRNILRPVLESSWSIFSENEIASTKSLIFDALLEPERYIPKKVGFWCWKSHLPFGLQKDPNSNIKVEDR